MRRLLMFTGLMAAAVAVHAEPRVVELPGKSPLVTIRFVFTTWCVFFGSRG